jgi:putative membrane protein
MRFSFLILLKGLAMGAAEVVPGVSGGTIAFITGIYERLIESIKSFDWNLWKVYSASGLKGIWRRVDGWFLASLLSGMLLGLVTGIFFISYLLEHYPVLVWAFFFGLIVCSAFIIGKRIEAWHIREILLLLFGALIAFYITSVSPVHGYEALWYVFLCGMIAVSALILPGISGSFMLLLLGMYTFILSTVKEWISTLGLDQFIYIIVFLGGCIVGLFGFSRILSWTFKHYRYPTLATLIGFIIGSLNKIWPWRNPVIWLDQAGNRYYNYPDFEISAESMKVIKESNVLPNHFYGDPMVGLAILSFIIGVIAVYLLDRKIVQENF